MNLVRGKFRVRGDTIEVHPAYDETAVRIELFGDEIERIQVVDPLTGEKVTELDELIVFPATHYVTGDERMQAAIVRIETELQERLAQFEKEGKLLEAQRLRMRTQYDLEMMQEVGYCNGIENYSGPIDGRGAGRGAEHAARLLPRRLPGRHRREPPGRPAAPRPVRGRPLPQGARSSSTASGCRRPADNRPLRFEEVIERVGQVVFLSATPGPFELEHSAPGGRADRAARPAWSTPRSIVKPTKGQIDDLIEQINERVVDGRPRCSSPRSPRRWPRTSPTTCSSWACGCATSTRGRHHPAHRDPPRPPPRRVRRAGRHQPAAGGPRPARGVAGGDPRRRQGGLPALARRR